MPNVFLYETLRNLSTLSHVLGKEPQHEVAQALDVKKIDQGKGYFTLKDKEDHITDGVLAEIPETEMAKLDTWENKYERKEISLTGKHRGMKAWAYILKKNSMRKSFLEKLTKSEDSLQRAANAGLITFPKDIKAVNCANCMFVKGNKCTHPEVNQVLKDGPDNMCCNEWDHAGMKRASQNA